MNRDEAIAALGSVEAANAAVARAANCPPWRHAAFGALMGLVVLSQGVEPRFAFALQGAAMLAVAAIFVSDRRRMGVFVNGYRKGATRPLTLFLLGAMLVSGWSEFEARHNGLSLVTRLGIASIAAILATAMSVRWQQIFRRELGVAA